MNRIVLLLFVFSLGAFHLIRSNKVARLEAYAHLAEIQKDSLTAAKAYHQVMDVLMHPRCMNCHPTDDVPKQGMDRHPHYFGMSRGIKNKGFSATKCTTCHQEENNLNSGVPGAPHWSLAPASMGWQGLSRSQIAQRLLNPATNGGKSHEELVTHMTEDELVLWAWNPGVDANGIQREKPPVSEEDFKKAVEKWFDEGAPIPSK